MRKLILLTLIAVLGSVVMAVPAAADAPEEFVITRTMEGEIDPCTGETMDVYFTWIATEHDHENNQVTRFDGSSETSTGRVATGTETQVINKKWFNTVINWVSNDAENDTKFKVHGHVKIELATGEFTKMDITFSCNGG